MVDRAESWAERVSTPWVWLAKIEHPLLEDAIRVAVDSADVTFDGEVYRKGRLGLVPPNFAEGDQVARVRIANVDRALGLSIQRMVTPAAATFSMVNANDPDTGAVMFPPMLLTGAEGNAMEITGEFRSRLSPQDAWPKERATKELAPGLFV